MEPIDPFQNQYETKEHCPLGYYKSRTPVNGRTFSYIKCKNCGGTTTKRTDCSGRGMKIL